MSNLTDHAPECIVSRLDDADESDCDCEAWQGYLNEAGEFDDKIEHLMEVLADTPKETIVRSLEVSHRYVDELQSRIDTLIAALKAVNGMAVSYDSDDLPSNPSLLKLLNKTLDTIHTIADDALAGEAIGEE